MSALRNLAEDVFHVCAAAWAEWRFRRHLRRGGCPDVLPF